MEQKLEATPAADIRAVEDQMIELPHDQNGVKVRLRIRALNQTAFTIAMQSIPAMVPADNSGRLSRADEMKRGVDTARAIAKVGIVSPEFSFGEREEGKPHWDDLIIGNQNAAAAAIQALSGIGDSKDSGVARVLLSFPVVG